MRIVVMGTGPFAVPTFHWLLDSEHDIVALVTRPTPPARGRRKSPVNPMRDVAQDRGLRILEPPSINDDGAIDTLEPFNADLFVVCDYGQILSSRCLATASLGGINLHGSLLPKYRGAAPVNWAMYNGDASTGVTVIHMSPKLDAGPSLTTRETPIDRDETAVELEKRLSTLGVGAVQEAIGMLANWDGQTQPGEIQDPAQATKAPRLKKTDGAVNWNRAAHEIRNQVRAFKPWPATYTHWLSNAGEPMRLILDWVSILPSNEANAPGTVLLADGKQLRVATGGGVITIDRIQPAGKRVMNIDDFLRGHPMREGEQFGDVP